MASPARKTDNKRKFERIYMGRAVHTFDVMTGADMGEVVNLTIEGMMMVMPDAAAIGQIYQLSIRLPQSVDGVESLEIGAECLWTSPATVAGRHWAGFQIIDAAPRAERMIIRLMEDHGLD